MTNGDIHNRENKIQNTVENLQELDISDRNLELIKEFKNYLQAQALSIDRISRYLYTWKQLLPHINWDLDQPNKQRIVELVGKINQAEL